MPDYRRYRVRDGAYVFTVNLLEGGWILGCGISIFLREAVRGARQRYPFHIDAWGGVPDHLHGIWTLPEGDDDFSMRWRN